MTGERGKFLVFEGLDGSGQTTQAEKLRDWMEQRGIHAYYTKEPSEGPVGSLLRMVLSNRVVSAPFNAAHRPLDEQTLALFFAADRMDHLDNEIIPKLTEGLYVICDRYYLSSLAFQPLGKGVDIEWVKEINSKALTPDLTFFLDVPPEECKRRMARQRWHVELYEELDKMRKVYGNYHAAIRDLQAQGDKIAIIPNRRRIEEVHRDVIRVLKAFLATGEVLDVARAEQLELDDDFLRIDESSASYMG